MQVLENYGKFEKIQRYKTSGNREVKELFSNRTKLSYYKVFHRKCVSDRNENKNKKTTTTIATTKMFINKPVCLRISILELSKILIYEFWYYYLKSKYGENAKLCYTDTDRFIFHVKADDIYKILQKMLKLDTSNYELDRKFIKNKNKKII